MPKDPENNNDKPESLCTIEELARKHGTPEWQQAGLIARMGWGAGKRVSDAEYKRELNRYLSGPMCQ